MDQANLVGQGFDIFGAYNVGSLISPIFDYSRVSRNEFTFLNKTYSLPSIVNGYVQTSSRYVGGTYISREGFQNKIAAHAKVQAGYGAFSGQMEASFSMEKAISSEFYYAFRNFYTQLGYLEILPQTEALSPAFVQSVQQLPDIFNKESLPLFADFFEQWGIYYVRRVTLGAAFEFYEAVSTATSSTTVDVGVMLEAHYRGLFATGKVSSSITDKAEWKSYLENSEISLKTTGGDPTLAARLTGIDAKAPSQSTVDAYFGWLESVAAEPAAVEFQLSGIWELGGEKRQAIQDAWREYGLRLHPKLSIETTSPAISAPTVLLGRQLKPQHDAKTLFGYQVLLLDRRTLLEPEGVVFNRYYTMTPATWPAEFADVYNQMANDVRASGYASEGYVLVLASFGIQYNCSPTPDFYGLLRSAGGGSALQQWFNGADPGSNNADALNYLFAGIFNQGPGTGFELVNRDWQPKPRLESQLSIYFYRRRDGDRFTLGRAPASGSGADIDGDIDMEQPASQATVNR